MSDVTFGELDQLCINTIRTLAIDAIEQANSGHPGLPLGAAPMAYVLWQYHLKHNPKDPQWPDRDRFVLSAGHGSMLLYALLHLTGYELTLDDLKNFRQHQSRTPGHPETFLTPGVEATTGPLGQGTANAVGMAIAERALAHLFNRPGFELVDHFTYALVSDGDIMEGISAEAASLAGHLKLGKLIYLYDANNISLDGPTHLTFTEDFAKRYEAYGWQVLDVKDGDADLDGLHRAISAAKTDTQRPSLIIVRTTIGFGSPNKAGTSSVHGSPLGKDEVQLTKEALGWSEAPFTVPVQSAKQLQQALVTGEAAQSAWKSRLAAYAEKYPDLFQQWQLAQAGKLPENWHAHLPDFPVDNKMATRKASGQVLNAMAAVVPTFLGGDADLSVSTNTAIKDGGSFEGQTGRGRNIHYGVREHAMASIANGMAYHGGLRTYTATFFCFSDYMRPAVRLAALNGLPVIHVWTHDSVWLGEDGPTHQPVEHLMSLRAMPNMLMLRPADAQETKAAWRIAMEHTTGPVGMVLTRQNLPALSPATDVYENTKRGAYILQEASNQKPELILMATGSEVALAVRARELLEQDGIPTRVVSMPSWELFAKQDAGYQRQVLPPALGARVAIEAGVTLGWERYVGPLGTVLGIDRFGASAPLADLEKQFGFTPENVVSIGKKVHAKATAAS